MWHICRPTRSHLLACDFMSMYQKKREEREREREWKANIMHSTFLNLIHAEKKFGKRGNTILMEDGSQVEELVALRENDNLFIF